MKKKICIPIIIFIVSFIMFVISLGIAFQEQTYLDITEENKQMIYDTFSNYVENVKEVNRISAGSGFHSGELCLYYENGKQETLYVYGNSRLGEIDIYIRENGYNYDNILMVLASISFIIIFSIFIYVIYCICKLVKRLIWGNQHW